MVPILECVPNFSVGRDMQVLEAIADHFRGKQGVKLLDYTADADHNRSVITAVGQPEALRDALVSAVGEAVKRIDLNCHTGQHPRIGAADVVPFIPIRGCTMAEADAIARQAAAEIARRYDLPCYLYERSATAAHRKNLADVRKGEFEGLPSKMQDPLWKPDFGPEHSHPTAGATVIGARAPLIAFNVNLNTSDVRIAKAIARRVRHSSGGYRSVKALGVLVEQGEVAQVTMNLTDYTDTAVYRAFEAVKMEAARYGVGVRNSELIGLIPMQAVADCAAYYLQMDSLNVDRILESGLEF